MRGSDMRGSTVLAPLYWIRHWKFGKRVLGHAGTDMESDDVTTVVGGCQYLRRRALQVEIRNKKFWMRNFGQKA